MSASLAWRGGGDEAAATLVLLHGLTDSGDCWADAVPRWAAQGWRVVTVDARGHGHSPRWTPDQLDDAAGPAPGDVMADDVLSLLTSVATGPVVLVGHSMGAAVAVAAAARTASADGPDVVAVVAEDPPWHLPPPSGPDPRVAARYLAGWQEDAAMTAAQRVDVMRRDHPHWPVTEIQACAVARDLCQRDLLATGDIVPRTPWPDLVSILASGAVPLLLVTGDTDVRVGQESAFVAGRRGAQVERISAAGHCVRRDAGDRYHQVVDEFLRGLRR